MSARSIAIIVPAYNEESILASTLEAFVLLGADELLVVDGQSQDRTREIASQWARVISVPPSRAVQMNAGAALAACDILLFLHADVRLNQGALEAVRSALHDPAVVGGNFDIRYDGSGWVPGLFTRINRFRRRFGIFYGDSGIFCRRMVFQAVDGFPPWPVLEDYEFARRLRKAGRLAFLREPIRVSDRRWREGGLLATLWSWFWIQGLYLAGVSPHRLAHLYRNVR